MADRTFGDIGTISFEPNAARIYLLPRLPRQTKALHTMKMFETILKVVFAMTAVGVGCYPLYAYWKIYQLYKLAGERVEKIGFFWFSFHVQSPGFGGGVEMLEALPRDLQRLATSVRDRQRKFCVAIVLWIAFLNITRFSRNEAAGWAITSLLSVVHLG